MQFKKILMPTDFSESSNGAISLAGTLSKALGAELVLAHVMEPATAYVGSDIYIATNEVDEEPLKARLEEMAKAHPDLDIETRVTNGDVASAIIDLANEIKSDLIVMGTHGRTGIARMLMGSVAESVMRSAPCPVLSYKHLVE